MSDNLELGRIEQNKAILAVNIADTALSRLDGRFSAPLSIDVGSDNAHTIAQNDLRFVSHIVLNPGSPAASAAVTITVTPTDTDQSPPAARDMGGFFVINKSGFAATIQITGQTNTAPVIATDSGGIIHVTSTGVWGVTGSSVTADDVTFSDPIAGSPPLDNVQEALAYLLGNPFGGGGGGAQTKEIGIACSDETSAIQVGTAVVTFRMPFAMTLSAVRASLSAAAGSGTVTVDINETGASILSTKLTIDAGEKTSTTAASAAVISDSALADDAEITIDIDATDSGSPQIAAGLKVWLIGTVA